MMKPTRPIELYTIRHGETEYNAAGKIQGQLDSQLTERGRSEVSALGHALRRRIPRPDALFRSPMGRVKETRDIMLAAAGTEWQPAHEEVLDDLREISCGDYEGKLRHEMDSAYFDRMAIDPCLPWPNGENILDVMRRAARANWRIMEWAANQSPLPTKSLSVDAAANSEPLCIVIIAHGNFNRCHAAELSQLGPDFAIRFSQANAALNHMIYQPHYRRWKILFWNDISHTRPNE